MTTLNQFDIAQSLGSEIIGRSIDHHGQISVPSVAQNFLELRTKSVSPSEVHGDAEADTDRVITAFYDVRSDRGSPDLYVADPDRNRQFLKRCRDLGEQASDYVINKALLNARKANLLKGLNSQRTTFDHSEYVFASECAATELRYRTGASVDDIICDPELAAEFDAIAERISPGFPSLRYRWALLSVRKAGNSRTAKWKPEYEMPKLEPPVPLFADVKSAFPEERGVYILLEKSRTLYVHGAKQLCEEIDRHRQVDFRRIFAECLWEPNLDNLFVSYAAIAERELVRPVEYRLIEERKPLFNIVSAA